MAAQAVLGCGGRGFAARWLHPGCPYLQIEPTGRHVCLRLGNGTDRAIVGRRTRLCQSFPEANRSHGLGTACLSFPDCRCVPRVWRVLEALGIHVARVEQLLLGTHVRSRLLSCASLVWMEDRPMERLDMGALSVRDVLGREVDMGNQHYPLP